MPIEFWIKLCALWAPLPAGAGVVSAPDTEALAQCFRSLGAAWESGNRQGQGQVRGKDKVEAAWECDKGSAKHSTACESGMDRGRAAWESGEGQGQGQVLGKGNVEAAWKSGKSCAKHSSACESGKDRSKAAWESRKGQGQGQVLGKDVVACESGKDTAKHWASVEDAIVLVKGMAVEPGAADKAAATEPFSLLGSHPCGKPTQQSSTEAPSTESSADAVVIGAAKALITGPAVELVAGKATNTSAAVELGAVKAPNTKEAVKGKGCGMAACESGRGDMVNHSLYQGSHPCGIPTKSLETQGQGQVQVWQRSACESGKGAAVQAFLGQEDCEGGNGNVAFACESGNGAADFGKGKAGQGLCRDFGKGKAEADEVRAWPVDVHMKIDNH